MARDPRIWDEPNTYKPERWLKEYNPKADSLPSVYDIVFGFGRR
jgi:cytochrome P450